MLEEEATPLDDERFAVADAPEAAGSDSLSMFSAAATSVVAGLSSSAGLGSSDASASPQTALSGSCLNHNKSRRGSHTGSFGSGGRSGAGGEKGHGPVHRPSDDLYAVCVARFPPHRGFCCVRVSIIGLRLLCGALGFKQKFALEECNWDSRSCRG